MQRSFEEDLLTTIANFTPSKEAIAPIDTSLDDYLFGAVPLSARLAPSSLAMFDGHAPPPAKRPRMSSTPSEASSVPSFGSTRSNCSSSPSSSTLVSPSRADDLSPSYPILRSPLDPGLFAALQETYLEDKARSKSTTPCAPLDQTYFAPHVSAHGPVDTLQAIPDFEPLASLGRAPRPPPLDLSGLSNLVPPPPLPRSSRSLPSLRTEEETERVMLQIDSLVARQTGLQQSRPAYRSAATAPLPIRSTDAQYNVAGVSLGLGDLEMLGGAPASWPGTYNHLPSSAPAYNFGDPFVMPMPAHLGYSPGPTSLPHARVPSMGLPSRPRSAPSDTGVYASGRRATGSGRTVQRKTSFVNFSAKDAPKLLAGVAPSGSSKRKREERERAQAQRNASA